MSPGRGKWPQLFWQRCGLWPSFLRRNQLLMSVEGPEGAILTGEVLAKLRARSRAEGAACRVSVGLGWYRVLCKQSGAGNVLL